MVYPFQRPSCKRFFFFNFLPFSFLLCEIWVIRILTVCVRFPKFSSALGGLPGLSIRSCLQLWFAAVEGYRSKAVKEKGTWAKSRKIRHKLPRALPQWTRMGRAYLCLQWVVTTRLRRCQPEKRIRVYTGGRCAWHVSNPRPLEGKESRRSWETTSVQIAQAQWAACLVNSGHGGNPPEIQVPRCQPRVKLMRSFKEEQLTLFCTLSQSAEDYVR